MASNFNHIPLLSDAFLERLLRQVDTPNLVSTTTVAIEATKLKKPQTRCPICRHKLLLSDIECKCGMRHCSQHRLPESHACTFDHKKHDLTVLEAQVTQCIADKLNERI